MVRPDLITMGLVTTQIGELIEVNKMFGFKKVSSLPELIPPFQIGDRFTYLGLLMICRSHHYSFFKFPIIVANYVDQAGQIKTLTFFPDTWPALIREQYR